MKDFGRTCHCGRVTVVERYNKKYSSLYNLQLITAFKINDKHSAYSTEVLGHPGPFIILYLEDNCYIQPREVNL